MRNAQSDDATQPPTPGGGWSTRLRTVEGALVVPATVPDMIQPAGVFDAAGAYVHEAVLWRGRALMTEPARPEPEAQLAGRWLWGGVLLNHFGHFLTESTGRLWGLGERREAGLDGIVFISKRGEADEAGEIGMQPYHRLFFDLLRIDLPIRVLAAPTVVERLEVPGQGFGIGGIAAGTDAFRRFVKDRFGADVAAEGAERLYISRSGLGATRGGVLEEQRIEAFLQAQGYEIFHPQQHPLTVQIARYKAARQIVALDGSALHLVAMLCQPDQEVAIIRRRNSGASDTIVTHLASFMGRRPALIDVIKQDWVRSDRRKADRFSVGELDFPALGAELGRLGFVPAAARMPALSPAEAQAAIDQIEAKLRRGKLKFEPLARGTKKPRVAGGDAPVPTEPSPAPVRVNARRAARQAQWAARRKD